MIVMVSDENNLDISPAARIIGPLVHLAPHSYTAQCPTHHLLSQSVVLVVPNVAKSSEKARVLSFSWEVVLIVDSGQISTVEFWG